MSQLAAQKRARLQTIVAERAAWASQLAQVKGMHGWVLEIEPLLDSSWAEPGEVVSNATVASRLDAWREQMAKLLADGTLSDLEQECRSRVLAAPLQPAPLFGAVLRPQELERLSVTLRALCGVCVLVGAGLLLLPRILCPDGF